MAWQCRAWPAMPRPALPCLLSDSEFAATRMKPIATDKPGASATGVETLCRQSYIFTYGPVNRLFFTT